MTPPSALHFILALSLLTGFVDAEAPKFPFAEGTFEDSKLAQWSLERVRKYRDDTIGNLKNDDGSEKTVPQKDAAADPTKLNGYPSHEVELNKIFPTELDLTNVQSPVFVAIHADDVAILTATQKDTAGNLIGPPLTYKLMGTALWRAERSYKEFPVPIPPGTKYHLTLDYSNTANLTDKYDGLIDFDGVNVFLRKQSSVEVDLKIASFQDKPDLAEDRNAAGNSVSPLHEMDPGSIVLAPVEGYHTPGTRSKLTLTAANLVATGEFRLKAETLPNVAIYETPEGGEPITLQKTWQASEFPGTVTYYVGAKAFTPTQAAEVGTLIFSYHTSSSETQAASHDTVKVTIEPAAIDAAIVHYPNDAEDLPDDRDPAASELHDMEPGGIVISSIETDSGIVPGARTRLTLDVVNVPTNTGTYKLTKSELENIIFYKGATGDEESNLEWTDADFEGDKKVTLYLGAKPMKIGEPVQSGTLIFTYKREASEDGITYEIEDKVKVTISTPVDIDVDSTNNEGFEFTWGDDKEDKIEASAAEPGKIIAVPLNPDADNDTIPDALDGFDGRGGALLTTKFVQMVVSIPSTCDPDTATVVLDYKMSDPRGLATGATIAPSGFRLWTKNAGVARSTAAIAAGADSGTGYFVPAGKDISWKHLAAICKEEVKAGVYQGPAIILYIETVLTKGETETLTELPFAEREPITVTAKSDSQSASFNTTDTVNIGVRCTGGVKLTGPKAIVVNDDHDNLDPAGNQIDKWDYTNDQTGTLDTDVQPIFIEVNALDQDVEVTLSSDAMKGLGETGTPDSGGLIDGVFPGGKDAGDIIANNAGQSKKGWIKVPHTFVVPAKTTFKQNLYIEGQRHSATVDDVVIKLKTTGEGIVTGNPKPCIATSEVEHKMTVYQVDLDVDSNNDEGFAFISGSNEEDWIENATRVNRVVYPGDVIGEPRFGKILINNNRTDTGSLDQLINGGAPGLAAVSAGLKFVPIRVELKEPFDPATTMVKFEYDASEPKVSADGIEKTGAGTATDPFVYTVKKGGMRLWKKDASARTSVTDDYIPSATEILWTDLPSSGPRTATLYLEYVDTATHQADGQKTVKLTAEQAGATKVEDSVKVFLLPVEFITPSGDPVAQPKDAGDGQNEFTFNAAKPGVLEINLKVKIPGVAGMPADFQNKFGLEVDTIGNSHLENAGGKPIFSGDFMTAKLKFTGLPQSNSDFGSKMARIKFDGVKIAEEDFEVFYSGTAQNHQDQTYPNFPIPIAKNNFRYSE